MMSKFVLPAALAAVLLTAAPVRAQVIDVSTIKCKEFLEGGEQAISLIIMWLDAYYRDDDDPAVIDFDKMKVKTGKLAEYCKANPTIGLTTAAEPIMSK